MADLEQLRLDFGEEWKQLLGRFYPLLLGSAFENAGVELGVTLAFNLENPLIQEAYNELTGLVKRVAETTHEDIVALVKLQAREGFSVDELAERILALGKERSLERAKSIAQTEAASAYSKGSMLAYQQSGVVWGTEWIVKAPCPVCDSLAGQKRALNEDYLPGIKHPPAHARCKCAIVPALSED